MFRHLTFQSRPDEDEKEGEADAEAERNRNEGGRAGAGARSSMLSALRSSSSPSPSPPSASIQSHPDSPSVSPKKQTFQSNTVYEVTIRDETVDSLVHRLSKQNLRMDNLGPVEQQHVHHGQIMQRQRAQSGSRAMLPQPESPTVLDPAAPHPQPGLETGIQPQMQSSRPLERCDLYPSPPIPCSTSPTSCNESGASASVSGVAQAQSHDMGRLRRQQGVYFHSELGFPRVKQSISEAESSSPASVPEQMPLLKTMRGQEHSSWPGIQLSLNATASTFAPWNESRSASTTTASSSSKWLMPIIEPDDNLDMFPDELEVDEAYCSTGDGPAVPYDMDMDMDIPEAIMLAKDDIPLPLRRASAPAGIRKHGSVRYRTSADVALRCANVMHSKPRMRKRKKVPGVSRTASRQSSLASLSSAYSTGSGAGLERTCSGDPA